MNNLNAQLAIMVIVSALLSSMLYIDNAEARAPVPTQSTEADFLAYCGAEGKSATDPNTGKYYCCLKNDKELLGNRCITCDVDRSGNKSNCVAERRDPPRGRFEPVMKNTNENMAPKPKVTVKRR